MMKESNPLYLAVGTVFKTAAPHVAQSSVKLFQENSFVTQRTNHSLAASDQFALATRVRSVNCVRVRTLRLIVIHKVADGK